MGCTCAISSETRWNVEVLCELSYQGILVILLSGLKCQYCLVYVEDVIVFSEAFEDHLQYVKKVLSTLKNAGISLNMKKCKFFSRTATYLGHLLRPGRLGVSRKNKASCITDMTPEFLGYVEHLSPIRSKFRTRSRSTRPVPNERSVTRPFSYVRGSKESIRSS